MNPQVASMVWDFAWHVMGGDAGAGPQGKVRSESKTGQVTGTLRRRISFDLRWVIRGRPSLS